MISLLEFSSFSLLTSLVQSGIKSLTKQLFSQSQTTGHVFSSTGRQQSLHNSSWCASRVEQELSSHPNFSFCPKFYSLHITYNPPTHVCFQCANQTEKPNFRPFIPDICSKYIIKAKSPSIIL
jgi:hypothetical protein